MKKVRSFYHLPLSSLQWLLTGLFLAALPLWFQLPAAVIFGFLGCLVWRFILEQKGLRCPRIWLRCVVGVAGLALIYGLHGTLIGLTAGMGLLLLQIALKVLEMRTEREFILLGFLAFFILLTSLFFSQTLFVCAYVGVVFLILTATLMQFTGGSADGMRWRSLLRYTGGFLLQASPLILLLFVFLPRMKPGNWFQLNKSKSAQSGMSEQMNPGSFAEMALSEEPVFRADFPEGNKPGPLDLYWRVAVFSECQGLAWRRDGNVRDISYRPRLSGERIVQRILMEPHAEQWVYALDRPEAGDQRTYMGPGNVLMLNTPGQDRRTPIRVVSRLSNDAVPLSAESRERLTEVPADLGPRTRRLVANWLSANPQPRSVVARALRMFREENFRYTLSPGTYASNDLDEFLFDRRLGFCEHFSASFATMMRLAGIPARVIGGYHGGEQNRIGDFILIKQADAHAWVEVWLENEGWVRFDPANSVDPSRMDAATQLANRNQDPTALRTTGNGQRRVPAFLDRITRSMRQGWDTVNFQWNLRVLTYDHDAQRDFYRSIGIWNLFSWKLLAILGGGILLVLGVVFWVMRPKPEKRDRSLLVYRQWARLLARAGIERKMSEGPLDFALRAALEWPEEAPRILAIADAFAQWRYGRNPGEHLEGQIKREMAMLRREVRQASRKTIAVE